MPKYYIDGPRDYNGGVHQIWGRNVYTIRQTRFVGIEHPHDVCAVGPVPWLKKVLIDLIGEKYARLSSS